MARNVYAVILYVVCKASIRNTEDILDNKIGEDGGGTH